MLKLFLSFLASALLVPVVAKEEPKQFSDSTLQFNYKMILKVDMKKRQQILKANGEEPTIFDKALTYMSGDIHAANVVDISFKTHCKTQTFFILWVLI